MSIFVQKKLKLKMVCYLWNFKIQCKYIELLIKSLLATKMPVPDENFRLCAGDKTYLLVILHYKALVALLTYPTAKCYIFMDP